MIPKFRVFIKMENAINPIQSVTKIDFETKRIVIEQGLGFDFDNVVLMQSTGLKDKNGVEIFEGDIVKRTHLFDGRFNKKHIGEVVYDKEYARYVISKPYKFTEPKTEDLRNTLSEKSTYEVIGNIWEDGELLEVAE